MNTAANEEAWIWTRVKTRDATVSENEWWILDNIIVWEVNCLVYAKLSNKSEKRERSTAHRWMEV